MKISSLSVYNDMPNKSAYLNIKVKEFDSRYEIFSGKDLMFVMRKEEARMKKMKTTK